MLEVTTDSFSEVVKFSFGCVDALVDTDALGLCSGMNEKKNYLQDITQVFLPCEQSLPFSPLCFCRLNFV